MLCSVLLLSSIAAAPASPPARPAAKPTTRPSAKPEAARPQSAPMAASAAAAEPKTASVGAKLNASFAGGALGFSPGLAVEVRKGAWLDGRLGLAAELGVTYVASSGTFTSAEVPPGQTWRVSLVSMPLSLSVFYAHPLSGALSVYGQAGVVGAWMRATTEAGGGENVEHGGALGFEAAAGGEYAVGPGRIIAELGYRGLRSRLNVTGVGNPAGPALRVGYRLLF